MLKNIGKFTQWLTEQTVHFKPHPPIILYVTNSFKKLLAQNIFLTLPRNPMPLFPYPQYKFLFLTFL